MTLLQPSALYLASLAIVVLLLHFLRAREQRREVSVLFLWENLPSEPRSRAAQFRQQIDPLLILQLAALLALALALAAPARRALVTDLGRLAILIDGSASMRTIDEAGRTRYDSAREQARAVLAANPIAEVVLIQVSSSPDVLAAPAVSRDDAEYALTRSGPTWNGDATTSTVLSILSAYGSVDDFERVILLTDHVFDSAPPGIEQVLLDGGVNRSIVSFSVRQSLDGPGVVAFVALRNDSDSPADGTIRLFDGRSEAAAAYSLTPHETAGYVIPFPEARRTVFVAELSPSDGFTGDDLRYYALNRPADLRVRWIGDENRYLLASLLAVTPIVYVEDGSPADLTVVVNDTAPEIDGNVLLVHSSMPGVVEFGPVHVLGNTVRVFAPDDPLLEGVDATDFRARKLPISEPESQGTILADMNGMPLLVAFGDHRHRILFIAPDLMETNLPITVDFPILIGNFIRSISRVDSPFSLGDVVVGEPVSLLGRGTTLDLYDPAGNRMELPAGWASFRPTEPGLYVQVTDRGTFAFAANVSASESVPRQASPETTQVTRSTRAETLVPLWPYVVLLAIVLLAVEAAFYAGLIGPRRRHT